jgi:hypothetical protein
MSKLRRLVGCSRTIFLLVLLPASTHSLQTYSHTQNVDKNWVCPDIMVDCPENSPDGIIRFRVRVALGVPPTQPKFKWKVLGGKITKGQGTEEITVKSKRTTGKQVVATVYLARIPKGCIDHATCRTAVAVR